MRFQQGIERANVFDLPSNWHNVAHRQPRIQLGDWLLDEEVCFSCNFQTHTNVVTQINEFSDAARETVHTAFAVAVHPNALRANRQGHRVTDLANIDCQRLDLLATANATTQRSPERLTRLPLRRLFSPMKLATNVFFGSS